MESVETEGKINNILTSASKLKLATIKRNTSSILIFLQLIDHKTSTLKLDKEECKGKDLLIHNTNRL